MMQTGLKYTPPSAPATTPARDTMNSMTALITFLVLLFATIRFTRLIVTDKLSEPFRQFLVDKLGTSSWVTYLFFCPWCVGFWVSLASSAIAWYVGGLQPFVSLPAWFAIPAIALGMSYITGWVLSREDSE